MKRKAFETWLTQTAALTVVQKRKAVKTLQTEKTDELPAAVQAREAGGGRGVPRGRSQAHQPVLTAVSRRGATYAQQVPDTTATTLQENVGQGRSDRQ